MDIYAHENFHLVQFPSSIANYITTIFMHYSLFLLKNILSIETEYYMYNTLSEYEHILILIFNKKMNLEVILCKNQNKNTINIINKILPEI